MRKHYGVACVLAVILAMGITGLPRADAAGADLGLYGTYLDSDDFEAGYGAGAKLKLNLAKYFALDIRGSYLTFDDTEVDMIPVEAAALLQLPLGDALNLYGGVGAGYYFFDADRVELDDAVGFFPVAGVELSFGEIRLFAEARWLMLNTDVDEAKEELEDIFGGDSEADVDGVGFNVGIAINL